VKVTLRPKLFGSPLRTRILTLVAALEETYPTQVAKLLKASLFSVQRIVDDLELEGVIATRRFGNERRIRLNPSYLGARPLREFLAQRAEASPETQAILNSLRTRPRRAGKALEPWSRAEARRARRLARQS
jgi:hypothetical protein